jgi:hypothetical protein
MKMRALIGTALAAAMLALGGCGGDEGGDQAGSGTVQTAPAPTMQVDSQQAQPAPTPPPPPPDLRLEVNVAQRELYVYRNDQRIATHPVAVGTSEWPTRTGEWTIGQVVFNPRWTPPTDESWAEDEAVKEPGDPENPLGRAQLVYDAPRSIHGTNEPESLGKAESHGSIRIANDVAVRLARMCSRTARSVWRWPSPTPSPSAWWPAARVIRRMTTAARPAAARRASRARSRSPTADLHPRTMNGPGERPALPGRSASNPRKGVSS